MFLEVPDETYFTTLAHNAHLEVPGAYRGKYVQAPIELFILLIFRNANFVNVFFLLKGNISKDSSVAKIVRHKVWNHPKSTCSGKFSR